MLTVLLPGTLSLRIYFPIEKVGSGDVLSGLVFGP